MVQILVQPNKDSGFGLGQPNFQTTLFDYTDLNIDDQLPSAKQFYEEHENENIPQRIEDKDPKLEQLEKELEAEEDYVWRHRRRRKRSEQLADWLYEQGIRFGAIEHGNGCKCCTPPEIVEQNEKIWAQKWKEICKQKRISKKEQAHLDRWDKERQKFEDFRWRFL